MSKLKLMTADGGAIILQGEATAVDRTITLPGSSSTTLVTTGDNQTLTNKTISADSNTLSGIAASSFVLSNASGNIDGSAAQKAIPSGVVVGTTDTQTLTNKTLTNPVISGGTINNAAIGGTTAAAGSFTTLTTSSTVTHNGGTANGVAYLNGSKVLTTGTVLVFDGAQLFINGITAGRGASSVGSNTAFGINALSANTTGNQNTAIGLSALRVNTTGSGNTSIGRESLVYNTTGSNNTALGVNALWTNVSGSQSVAVGVNALFYNTASNNTAVGYLAGYENTTGSLTAVGAFAATTATTATGITAIGNGALRYTTTGSLNTAVGSGDSTNFPPLFFNTTGAGNVAVGVQTMYTNTTGSNNTAVGNFAMQANTTADNNTAVGTSALFSNTTGTLNTALGMYALRLNVAGTRNTAVGYNALQSYAASGQADNVAVGLNAMNAVASGTANTAVGNYALGSNATSTGSANSAVGTYALQTLTSGSSNTAMGFQAGYSLTTGSRNVLIGRNSAFGMSSGSENTVIGPPNGSDNGVGYSLTSGSTNTLLGINAALNLTSGSYNTIVGGYTLPTATTSYAVALADGTGNARFLYLNSTSAQARYASNETMLSYVSVNQGGVLRHRNIPVLGNPNGGTYKGYLILAKAYDGVVGQALSNVLGRFIFVRGGTGSGNRSSLFDVNCATAYSVTTVGISGLDQGDYAQRIVTCTYDSEQWIALETSQTGGVPDGGVFFEGTFQDAGMVYVDATYVSLISEFNSSVGLNVTNFGSTLNLNSGQIRFPATQNASSDPNTLDDYEEGTWTPSNAGDATGTISSASGEYIKIGRVVYIKCTFAVTANFTSHNIGGLPFTASSNTSLSSISGATVAMNEAASTLFAAINNDLSVLTFYLNANASTAGGLTTTNSVIRYVGVYRSVS